MDKLRLLYICGNIYLSGCCGSETIYYVVCLFIYLLVYLSFFLLFSFLPVATCDFSVSPSSDDNSEVHMLGEESH